MYIKGISKCNKNYSVSWLLTPGKYIYGWKDGKPGYSRSNSLPNHQTHVIHLLGRRSGHRITPQCYLHGTMGGIPSPLEVFLRILVVVRGTRHLSDTSGNSSHRRQAGTHICSGLHCCEREALASIHKAAADLLTCILLFG